MDIDYSTAAGQVRLLIADVDIFDPILDSDQIDGYLALNGGHVRRAAADALDAISTSEALVSKKIRTQDLATDGPAVAAELRARAKQLRDQSDMEDDDFTFEIVAPAASNSGRPEHANPPYPQVWGL